MLEEEWNKKRFIPPASQTTRVLILPLLTPFFRSFFLHLLVTYDVKDKSELDILFFCV